MGDVRKCRTRDDCEEAILQALARPLSYRELFARVGHTAMVKRSLARLINGGEVVEFATRRTFDFGVERLLKRVL